MKRLIILLLSFALNTQSFAQSPIEWKVSAVKSSDHTYVLKAEGTIKGGWHLYAETDKDNDLEHLQLNVEGVMKVTDVKLENAVMINDAIFGKKLKVYTHTFSISEMIMLNDAVPAKLTVSLKGFASNHEEFLPIEEIKEVALEGGVSTSPDIKLNNVNLDHPAASCGDESLKEASLFSIFIKGLAGGFIALLMPCLFPMIPVTVSFFTNRSVNRKQAIQYGAVYGGSILLIYLLASLPFHFLSGVSSQLFNTIATNAWVNLAFFVIFLIFALSLFGLFELRLPAALSNKAGSRGDISSLTGIFFMALTLVIVSFSCTGPILGTLLVGSISKQGNPWELTTGMAGFGLALALPFTLFAIFPSWLNRLPKSGGWLKKVKIVLAFVELALAFKFLSNADLVEHWGLLKREVFIAIWVTITIVTGLYIAGVFGKEVKLMKVVHPKSKFRFLKYALATICFLFAIYLIPGLTNTSYANLKLVSGFPPPLSYSIYNEKSKGVEPDIINDYDEALELSKKTGKPLLIDFTGWACVNCRKMEEQVWTEPSIRELIHEEFILVSLYVDDRKKLQFPFTYEDKTIRTVGDKWAALQAENFGGASQPMYVVLSPKEELMNRPVGYTAAAEYKDWLQCGLKAWEKKKHFTIQK